MCIFAGNVFKESLGWVFCSNAKLCVSLPQRSLRNASTKFCSNAKLCVSLPKIFVTKTKIDSFVVTPNCVYLCLLILNICMENKFCSNAKLCVSLPHLQFQYLGILVL